MESASVLEQREAQAAEVKASRERMEHQIGLLQSDAVDPDYLDELARQKLNYLEPGEKVVELPPVAPAQ